MLTLLVLCSLLLTVHGEEDAVNPRWTKEPTCYFGCGVHMGSCSCEYSCQYYGNCCQDYSFYCRTTTIMYPETTEEPSCRYNCSVDMGSCSCNSSCQYYGNCCRDYQWYCAPTHDPWMTTTTPETPATEESSCRYNCGNHMGFCSCTSSCQYYGNCCRDYTWYCPTTTEDPWATPEPSCRNNCGYHIGSCSCTSMCSFYGNCCPDYGTYCPTSEPMTTEEPSCRYNCGYHMGSCSCASSCQYYGNCCRDYTWYCPTTTEDPWATPEPSCRNNCGYHMGSCSCTSSCQYYGNCCRDYEWYCPTTTEDPWATPEPSCRNNCGHHIGSCSCTSMCSFYGNCCPDYGTYCPTSEPMTTEEPSCRYNCGYHMGSCSCASSCQYYGNCCHDYTWYCSTTTEDPWATPEPSCRNNCGHHMGSCSCTSSCQYYGNCCRDYGSYCPTSEPMTTEEPSCLYNCGYHMGTCSCTSSCQYHDNCCRDYHWYCPETTHEPWWPTTAVSCGGSLYGGGTFTSPNHPFHYDDFTRCEWQLRVPRENRVFLRFTFLELENCCGCDYISIYDGPSSGYPYLGKICNSSVKPFQSSGDVMTVVFQTDSSVVARGFTAEYHSILSPNSGSISCSSSTMTIVLKKNYLESLGYEAHDLFLNDRVCRPRETPWEVTFSFPIHACGNIQTFENSSAIYTNTLRAFPSDSVTNGVVTRQDFFRLNVTCLMAKESESHIMYVVNHNENSSIIGSGKFNTSMDFYTSNSFWTKVTEYPYEVSLNQYMYVQVDLDYSDDKLVVYIDTCVASPSPTDFESRPYYLVRNGCRQDQTYFSYVSGTRPYARFRFNAFQFLRATDAVYLQCRVLVCQASDSNSACRKTCNRRKKRDLESEHDIQTLVLGPIRMKAGGDKQEGSEKVEA